MKIVVCHSPNERCGVRQYGLALDEALRRQGAEVFAFNFNHITGVVMDGARLLVHFEPGLIGPELKLHFMRYLAQIRTSGVKVVFCCHYYDGRVGEEWAELVDSLAVHRSYPQPVPKGVEIPLGCPTYASTPEERSRIRARVGLPEDRLVVTTVGFLTRWKRLPEIVDAVASCLPERAIVRAQTPWPFDVQGSGADREHEDMFRVASRWGSKVQFATEFLPERELLDLVHASDVGFVFHPIDTGSVSAATKQFVAARCPLVVTSSTHSSDLRGGVHRVGSFDVGTFAREVGRIASDVGARVHMRTLMQIEYERINMDAVAARYIEVLR